MREQTLTIDHQAGLSKAIAGKSDRQIADACVGRCADVVRAVAQEFPSYFIAECADTDGVVVGYEVSTPDGPQAFQIAIGRGRCRILDEHDASPDVRLRVALPDFLRLACGQLSATRAFITGRVKVTGSILIARRMQHWFRGVQ